MPLPLEQPPPCLRKFHCFFFAMVYSYRGVMTWIAALSGLSVVQLEASSWPEEFAQWYEAHGLALLHTNEAR